MKSIKYVVFSCAVLALLAVGCGKTEQAGSGNSMATTSSAETIDTRIGELNFTHDFANGYPTHATRKKLFNEMDFQRATQAYLWAIPRPIQRRLM